MDSLMPLKIPWGLKVKVSFRGKDKWSYLGMLQIRSGLLSHIISAFHLIPFLWLKLFNFFPTQSLFWPCVITILFQVSLRLGKSSLLALELAFTLWFHFICPKGQVYLPTPLFISHSVLPISLLSTTFILSTFSLPTTSLGMMAPEFLVPTKTGWLSPSA